MKEIMGVIGYPIKHSLSPEMHSAAYKELGLHMDYHAYEVRPEFLEKAINGVRGLGLRGVNVTIPHKITVMQYLDMVDEHALEIGAVNTILNVNGQLSGYNTDGEGYLRSLMEFVNGQLAGLNVLIIGAGGAARAVAITLAKQKVNRLVIANRTLEKAEDLASSCANYCSAYASSLLEAEARLYEFDLLINTTSIGMTPNVDVQPITLNQIRPGTYVSDLIYTPLKTKWLVEAERRGAFISNGLDMFVFQGALAFERWTGLEAPVEKMRQAVLNQLK